MRIALILIVIIFLLTTGLFLTKNLILKTALEKTVSGISGLRLSIDDIDVGLVRSFIKVEGLKLFNPQGFRDEVMFEVPLLYIEYDIASLFAAAKEGGRIRVRNLVFDLKVLNVIRNERGVLNLNSLNIMKFKKPESAGRPVSIDRLHLKVDKVFYKDYSQPSGPKVVEFDLALDETYEGIDDPYSLGRLIVLRSLRQTTISRLANLDLSVLEKGLEGLVSKGRDIIGRTSEKVTGVSRDLTGEAAKTLEKATGLLKAVTGLADKEEQR